MKPTLRPQRRFAARTGPGISLFPFLAVLICTMGALVPLLLGMMHTARVQAEADAVAKATAAAARYNAELQVKREDVQWRIEQLKKSRTRSQSELADARLDLGHIEDHARRLRGELERYQNTVAELEKIENADHQQNGQSQAELQQLRQQIDVARQQVEQARKEVAGRPRSFAVVPYEGPNSTRRRPIYLECIADAVVIQPEGIRLTSADFEGPMGPGNPLAAALRAAREHLMAQRQFDPQAGEPYPLLLVRPEGIGAYYAAREAMKSWGCDFGYELIGDNWKLAYPPPNPQMTEVVHQAVASARINQERLIAAAPREYPSHKKAAYRASPQGGFARDDAGSDDGDDGYRPAGAAGAVGGNGGGYGGGDGYGGSGSAFGNGGHGSPGVGGYGGPGGQSNGGYNPYAALPERPGAAVPGSGGIGAPSSNIPSSTGPALASANGGNGGGIGGGGGLLGDIVGGNGGGTGGGIGNGNGGGMSPAGRDVSSNPMRGGGNGTAPNPYVTMPQGPETAGAGNGGTAGAYQRSEGSQNSGPAVARPDGYVVGQPAREAPSPTPPNSQQQSEGAEAHVLRPGEWEPTPEPPPKEDKKDTDDDKFGEKKHKPPRSLAERRGEDWGLRNAGRGSVGVTRPIRIECYADRLVVVSDRSPAESKVIGLGPRTASSIDAFISAIWGHIDGWGIAGRGMYWRPVLQVWVAPGGEGRFADLAALLDGSGLTVKRR